MIPYCDEIMNHDYIDSFACMPNEPKIMSLAVAAWRDMVLMIIQDRGYIAFKTQTAKVSGRGLNLKQRKECAERAEHFIERCCEALQESDIEAEAMLDAQPGQMFAPNKKSKT